MLNPSGALGLNIFGGSGYTSILGTTSLFMKSDFSSGVLDLFVKSNPPNSGKLTHENNWDFSLASRSRINHYSNADITYDITDYSSNKFDQYYDSNRGQNGATYTIGLSHSTNDIAIQPNVMAVANKDWTSFEKYSSSFNGNIVSAYISPINYYSPTGYETPYMVYELKYEWVVASPYCLVDVGGTLTINYDYGDTTVDLDLSIPAYPPGGNESGIIYSTSPTYNSISFDGTSFDWPNLVQPCFSVTVLASSIVNIPTSEPPPIGSILRGGRYILPDDLEPKLTNFLLPAMTPLFKDQSFDWMNYNQPNEFEVPDYSDIYLRIKYDNSTGVNPNYIYNTSPLADEKRYTFGGFIRIGDWLNGLMDRALLSDKTTVDGEDYLWHIIVKNDGSYYSVGLSNYVTWDYAYDDEQTADELPLLVYGDYEPVALRYIANFGVEIVKVAAFPNCGKVDLYFHKVGDIESFTDGTNIVYSTNHGLSDGDIIKITGGLGSGSTINGLKVVSVVNENVFMIYYDISLFYPATISNTTSGSGIRFTTVENETWKYGLTLYSPTGKNGYGLSKQLRTTSEPPTTFESPFDNAIETSPTEDLILRSHSSLKGERSWNNFYPFERFSEIDGVSFNVINGNKFGSHVAMRQYGDDYILAVSEPGASESFELISSYATRTDIVIPQNRKVVPNYFPYGRIHFFKVLMSSKTVEYITTADSSDNPWLAYETLTRINRVSTAITTLENMPLTNVELIQYNTTLSNYWNGARYIHWGQDYYFNSDLQLSLPDQNGFINYYGFVDSFGKSFGFEVNGDTIYCLTSASVKNADFENNLRVGNIDRYLESFYFDITTPTIQYNSLISLVDSDLVSADLQIQKSDIQKFGSSVCVDRGRSVVGWPSDHRDNEYIYYLSRSDEDYTNIQTISHAGNYGFGEQIALYDDMFLVNDSSSVYVYKYDYAGNRFYQSSSLLITARSFDLYRDNIVIRTSDSYIGYNYDHSDNELIPKFIVESPKTSLTSVVRMSPSDGTAFYDARTRSYSPSEYDTVTEEVEGFFALNYFRYSAYGLIVVTASIVASRGDDVITSTENDLGQFSQALVIVDGSQVNELSLNNYIITMDAPMPDYLPLFIKATEGSPTGQLDLNIWGNTSYTGGMDVFLLPPAVSSGNIDLFMKQLSIETGGIPLYTMNTITSGELDLIINGAQGYTLPLYLNAMPPVATGYSTIPLRIVSIYDTDPNVSGYMNLVMYSEQSADISGNMNLYIHQGTRELSSGVPLYINPDGATGISFNNRTLFTTSTGPELNSFSGNMNLVIQRPESVVMPLIVYNTTTQGNIPVYISGVNSVGTGISLITSGNHIPNSSINLFVRGDL